MNKKQDIDVLHIVIQFILIVVLQVLLMDKISLWGYVTPMIYIMFILSLPFQTPKWLLVVLGFITGIIEDLFTGMTGIHAASTTLIAFLRPLVMKLITNKSTIEEHLRPILYDMHFPWYIVYSLILTFIHQFSIFFLDALSFVNFGRTLWIGAINTIFTVVLILLFQCLFYNESKRY